MRAGSLQTQGKDLVAKDAHLQEREDTFGLASFSVFSCSH